MTSRIMKTNATAAAVVLEIIRHLSRDIPSFLSCLPWFDGSVTTVVLSCVKLLTTVIKPPPYDDFAGDGIT